MTIVKVREFLRKEEIEYEDIKHPLTFSAQETAATTHIKGKEFAKTILLMVDGKMVMTVLPASHLVDIEKLKKTLKANEIRLASEIEFKSKFTDCEVGAMPPFGNLYNMDLYLSETLLKNQKVTFNAGSHTEAMSLTIGEFIRIINPKVLDFTKKIKS